MAVERQVSGKARESARRESRSYSSGYFGDNDLDWWRGGETDVDYFDVRGSRSRLFFSTMPNLVRFFARLPLLPVHFCVSVAYDSERASERASEREREREKRVFILILHLTNTREKTGG